LDAALEVGAQGHEGRGPLSYGGDGAGETEAGKVFAMVLGGFEHQGSHEVIGDEVHGEFLVDEGGRFAAQDVHAHRDLDVGIRGTQ